MNIGGLNSTKQTKRVKKQTKGAEIDNSEQRFDIDDDQDGYEPYIGLYKVLKKADQEIIDLHTKHDFMYNRAFIGFRKFDKREFTTIEVSEGGTYEGYIILDSDLRDGQGMVLWADGSLYEGWWRDDKPHGNGIKVFNNKGKPKFTFIIVRTITINQIFIKCVNS